MMDTQDCSTEESPKATENPSQADPNSWSSGFDSTPSQKWSPQSLHDINRKSAFQPYKLCPTTSTTVLTNLQRGNTQAETLIPKTAELTFHMKAGQGELSIQDILKEEDVDVLDDKGLTALHWSSAYGQYSTVELLLNHNADVNKLGPDEDSPLIFAASGGHHEVVKLLISCGADVNHVDHLCNSPLMYAAKGNHPHTCQELLLQGANFGLVNLNDDTALSIATESNCTAAQVIIENYIISFMENSTKIEDEQRI